MSSWQLKINRFLDSLENMPGAFKRNKEKYQKRILLMLFFFLIAFILWFIRALNEKYEDEIIYPVKYTQLPENKILDGSQPENLKLRVQATGMTILTRQLKFNMSALRFNVESFSMVDSGKNSFYILTNQVKDYIEEDLQGIRVLSISPDSIHFNFIEVVTQKKPIKIVIKDPSKLLENQYSINGNIYSVPDSIEVKGPASILDTMNFIYTHPLDIKNLTDSVIKNAGIQSYNQIEVNQQKVKIVIPVDKYTESSLSIPIVALNVPDSIKLKTFPSAVKVTYTVTLSNYEKINQEMLIPYVNYFNIKIGGKLYVGLVDTPQWIQNLRISPHEVDFILE